MSTATSDIRQSVDQLLARYGTGDSESDLQLPFWWVLHARPRCEKKLEQRLAQEGATVYLPLQKTLRVYRNKKIVFHKPLFPGYLFTRFPLTERADIFRLELVAGIIPVIDQEQFEHQIGQIRQALASQAPIEQYPFMKAGSQVRVKTGVFAGLEGLVIRETGRHQLVISVDVLQKSVAMEVDPAMLEALH